MNIYAYWEGDNRHWFYDLCWESVKRHTPNAVLLSKSDVEDVLGPLPRELDNQYVVHQCDWIRKAFIHKVGGAWVDMDFVCWSDLSWMVEAAKTFDYVGWREWHGTGWMDNLFAARRGSVVMETAADYALDQMRQHGEHVAWLATNAHAMNHALGKHPWCKFLQLPTHIVGPVSVMDTGFFMRDVGETNVDDYSAIGFMTSMHGIGAWLKAMSGPDELINGKSVLGAIVRRSLGV